MEYLGQGNKVFSSAVGDSALDSIIVDYYKEFLFKVFPSKQLASTSCLSSMYYIEESTNISTGFFSKDKVVVNNFLEYARLRYDEKNDIYHVDSMTLKGENLEKIISSSTEFDYPVNIERCSSMVEGLTVLARIDKEMRLSAEKIIIDEAMLGNCHYRSLAKDLGHIIDLENVFHDCSKKGLTETGRFALTSLVDEDIASKKESGVEGHIENLFRLCIQSTLYTELNKTKNITALDDIPSVNWGYLSDLYKVLSEFSERKNQEDFSTKEKITEFISFSDRQHCNISRNVNPDGGGSGLSALCYERKDYIRDEFHALLRLDLNINWKKVKKPEDILKEEKADIKRLYENKKAEHLNDKIERQAKEENSSKVRMPLAKEKTSAKKRRAPKPH